MAKTKAIKGTSIPELQAQLSELDKEIFQLRNQLSLHRKLEKPHLIKEKRKMKAKILTLLSLKQKEAV